MRILLYGLNYAPELTGIGKFSGDLGSWLSERGHEVRVVTAPPYYPEWHVASGYRAWAYRRETIAGARVLRTPIWVPNSPRTFARLLHLASFTLSSLPAALMQIAWRPQVVLAVAPSLLSAPAALVVARLSGAKALLHFQDFEIEAAQGLGMISSGWLARFARRMERLLLNAFDEVSTISPRMKQRLAAKGVVASRSHLFPNWVDCASVKPLARESNAFRRALGLDADVKVAMYSGAMGEKQGLELVLQAAQRLQHRRDILFVLAGTGAARTRLEPQTAGCSNIRWLPLQPEAQLCDWLSFADLHLLPQRAGAADLVMPSKLTGMLASGRPVITTAGPGTQLAEVIRDRLGRVTPPDDVAAFASAIEELADDDALRASLGLQARSYAVENYDRCNVLGRFERHLLKLITPGAITREMKDYDA